MAVTEKNKRVVWALSGARCAICKKPLVEREDQADAYSFLGDVAHIQAKSNGGPRANAVLTSSDRDHPDNLLLLCLDHHKLVDDHSEVYSVGKMIAIKDAHHSWVRGRLSNGEPWTGDISNFFYINLPRVLMLAEVTGCGIDDPTLFTINDLSKLGGGYLGFIRSIRPVIEQLHPNVVKLDSLSLTDKDVGLLARFDQRCRTRGLGKALANGVTKFIGDLRKDPHIYTDNNGYKFVMPIDSRWITTTTAAVHLSSGQGVFSGICVINSLDLADRVVLCSPLVIGHERKW